MTEHRHPFLTRLHDPGAPVLLADGAIGTMLHERGVAWGRPHAAVTRDDRALVAQLHLDYLRAGAQLITTNTFGASRLRLAPHGLADQVRELNVQAVKVAREAREVTGRDAFVAGAIGAIVRSGEPLARRAGELRDSYREQALALVEGGCDLLHLETFTDLRDLELAIDAVRDCCDLPLLASASYDHDLCTFGDADPARVAALLDELGVDAIGINCSVGPHHALQVVEQLTAATDTPVSVMPNAGMATRRGANFLYHATPDYFADWTRAVTDAGAALVGGCCGTTPHHTAAMAHVLFTSGGDDTLDVGRRPRARSVVASPRQPEPLPVHDAAPQPTRLQQALDAGEFVVSVELAPPKGANPEKLLAGARMLEQHGLEFVNVTDSAMARVRMGSIAVGRLVQDHTSLEAVVHVTTRDRNLMALQGDLLGAHAIDVRNVLALTGDPPSIGDFPDATGVWDVDSIGLLAALANMNAGRDARGRDLGSDTAFCAGAAVNPTAVDLPLELDRFAQKLEAGAHFAMSQPVYDVATLLRFLERVDSTRGLDDLPLLLGVLPLQSARHAEYLHNEVPGIEVPEFARRAMHEAGADGIARGIELAHELIDSAQAHVDGIYLMPSFGRYEVCAQVLAALDSDRRPGRSREVRP